MSLNQIICIILWLLASCSYLPNYQEKEATVKEIPPVLADESIIVPYFNTVENSSIVVKYCGQIDQQFKELGWGKSYCQNYQWIHVRNSVLKKPLIWVVFGSEENLAEKEITAFFCAIHGDETPTVKFCFDLINLLNNKGSEYFKNKLVVVAPIVNPDSFFSERPTRTNARGVDLNRNFPTRDWKRDALRLWENRYKKDVRRYPGPAARSEPETIFHVNLIFRYRPDKIISLHSPLSLLDYDGPSKEEELYFLGSRANNLLIQMSQSAQKYRVIDFPFFPGSLGNWAGHERRIPTYTLELPSSDPRKADDYWLLFKDAMENAIEKSLKP